MVSIKATIEQDEAVVLIEYADQVRRTVFTRVGDAQPNTAGTEATELWEHVTYDVAGWGEAILWWVVFERMSALSDALVYRLDGQHPDRHEAIKRMVGRYVERVVALALRLDIDHAKITP